MSFLALSTGLSLLGTASEISSYGRAASGAMQAARFNAAIVDRNLNEQLGQLSREVRRISGAQVAGFGASGVSVSSGSALAVMNDTLSAAERQSAALKESARLEKTAILFEGRSAASRFRTQQLTSLLSGGTRLLSARLG